MLNASWKISCLAVNGQSFLVIDGYLLNYYFWAEAKAAEIKRSGPKIKGKIIISGGNKWAAENKSARIKRQRNYCRPHFLLHFCDTLKMKIKNAEIKIKERSD